MRWVSMRTAILMYELQTEDKRATARKAAFTRSAEDLARQSQHHWVEMCAPSAQAEAKASLQKAPRLEMIQDWMAEHWWCTTLGVSGVMVFLLFLFVHFFILS